MKIIVNKELLKALTKKELMEKYNQYHDLGSIKNSPHYYNIAAVYLAEYSKRKEEPQANQLP